MDYCEYNYNNDFLNNTLSLSMSNINNQTIHQNSILLDSGFESLLLSSSSNSSCSNDSDFNSNSGSLLFNCNNTSTTPDMKKQYVGDVNGFYFASIRSSASKPTTIIEKNGKINFFFLFEIKKNILIEFLN
jgi:hypothetical protein